MGLSKKDVEYVASLARLRVTESEIETLAAELGRILEYAGELGRLELEGVPITTHAALTQSVTRPDEPQASLPQEVTLANAPEAEEGQFKVPAVLEG